MTRKANNNDSEREEVIGSIEANKHLDKKFWLPVLIAVMAVAGYLVYAGGNGLWPFEVHSIERLSEVDQGGGLCPQEPVQAANKVGFIKEFPGVCDIPGGWRLLEKDKVKIESGIVETGKEVNTYINPQFGFQFNFPLDWRLEEYDPVKEGGALNQNVALLWINFFEKDENLPDWQQTLIASVEVNPYRDPYLGKNFSSKETTLSIGKNNVDAFIEIFPVENYYECYGVALARVCSSHAAVQVKNGGYWLVISALLEDKRVSDEYLSLLASFESQVGLETFFTWRTYKNQEAGFELQYPEDRILYSKVDEVNEILVPATPSSTKIFIAENESHVFCCEPLLFTVEILEDEIEDLGKWVEERFVFPENEYRVIKRGFETFAGRHSYRLYSSLGIDSPGNIIVFNNNRKGIVIRYDNAELLNQILSTFVLVSK